MTDIIRLLPDSVANQIAAGEVIQRPASVIKELVENSVDARATRIDIVLRDAGRTLIQVADNGSGMSDTDARMAFERHATSKIGCAADLFALHTMGFRGEALASIAAIARLDVRTQLKGAATGTRLVIDGSRVESQTPEAGQQGTNIMVKDLFFNVPARRRFLKKDATEYAAVLREFERLALVNPGLDFTLTHNDSLAHDLRSGTFLQRITSLFGKDMGHKLIPVTTKTSIVEIDGFISLPEHSRRRNPLQYFFVNGRNMKHPYYHKALMMCYKSLIAPDQQACYFLNFKVDPASIDVNIHPTKNEIKFEDEQAIWQILTSAVNESLGRYNAGPAIDFNTVDAPDIPVFDTAAAPKKEPRETTFSGYNPFTASSTSQRPPRNWETLYAGFEKEKSPVTTTLSPHHPVSTPSGLPSSTTTRQAELDLDFDSVSDAGASSSGAPLMQLRNRYIITPSGQGLMVIDQHRAHKLILYHQALARATRPGAVAASQQLMFAARLDLSPAQHALMQQLTPDLAAMGFDTSAEEGTTTWNVTGVPPALSEGSAREMLLSLLEELEEHDGALPAADDMRRRVALKIAASGAVRPGQPLRHDEMDRITASLFALQQPSTTPDGQPVFTVIPFEKIQDWLG